AKSFNQRPDAGLLNWVPARRAHEGTVRSYCKPLASRHERNVAGCKNSMNLVFVLSLDVHDLTSLPLRTKPLEIDAPGLLAEPEKQDLLRLILAIEVLAPGQAHNVRIDAGIVLRGLAIQSRQFRFGII